MCYCCLLNFESLQIQNIYTRTNRTVYWPDVIRTASWQVNSPSQDVHVIYVQALIATSFSQTLKKTKMPRNIKESGQFQENASAKINF